MGILGIENRTENWKTVKHFHGLCDAAKVALVHRLGEPEDTGAEKIGIELFWRPMRDHIYQQDAKVEDDRLVSVYRCLFVDKCNLREKIESFKCQPGFGQLKSPNYETCSPESLVNNVKNTEVDIVLATPTRIYIGEAKYESDLGTNGRLVLVHQLIRQYVAVRILVDLAGLKKCVIPFVVTEPGKKLESMKKKAQVRFMIKQGWLRKCNILSWNEVNDIRCRCR